MTDVFLSYAREDRERASVLAAALEGQGWSVWWDRKIVAGETFDETIEDQLATASSVVVLWSEHSVGSEWVRNEAGVASERDVLVPVLLDEVKLPLEFRRRQTVDLIRWKGDASDREFQALVEGIAAKTRTPIKRRVVPPVIDRAWHRVRAMRAIAAVTVVALVAAYTVWVVVTRERSVVDDSDIARLTVENASTSAGGDPDSPLTVALGTVQRIGLDANQPYYMRLAEPAEGLKIVLDMRRVDGKSSNLSSRLSVLDSDGAVTEERLINFNEIDVGARMTASWSTRKPAPVGFRLLNGDVPADFWFSVRREPAPQLVPFFGDVVPQRLAVGGEASGLLDVNEDAYYLVSLRQGDYQIIADFSNAERRNTNIQGSVALLDGDGGNYRELVRFNEVDVSARKTGTFLARDDGPMILNIQNTHDAVRYELRLAEAKAAARGVAPAPAQIGGEWIADAVRSGQRPFQIAFDLDSMDGRLYGTVHYPSGDAGIQDGEIVADRIRFRTVHTPQFDSAPAEIRFDGRIVGETIEMILQDSTGSARVTARRR